MQASVLYLTDTVDHKSRNHGRGARDVVRQHTLHTERGQTVIPVSDAEERCAHSEHACSPLPL